ncbi:MAG TPA: hypothetical protein VMM79_11170 [Longimicrobiales bacterium]|nr:hypothetical protein [Longimicrobiales bacterium]
MMNSRRRIWRNALHGVAIMAALAFLEVPAGAQTPPPTPWGDPDLQGTWDFTTITPLERPAQFAGREFLTDAEAATIEQEINRRRFESEEKDPGAFAPAAGDPNDPGIYNLGWWWEPEGRKLVQTRRTSLVIDPPDGRLPALTPQAQATFSHREEIRQRRYEPADLPLAERCILGFNSGPPMVPGPYNNLVQLFQAPGYVVIVNEMVHDARIVPLDGRAHVGSSIQLWTGDARGRWEGDTLVVETRNFTDHGTGTFGSPGLSDRNMHLVERFTRVDDRTLVYQFTVNDPTVWTRPWTAEVPMRRIDGFVMEYGCHEGNYGLANILAGARAEERAGR